MADIKPGRHIEKPLYNLKSLKERIGQGTERQRIKKLEEARKLVINEIVQTENAAPATIGPVVGVAAPSIKQQKQIENVLASGLEDLYLSLAPEKQKQFRQAGEETANKINKILSRTRVNIGAIVRLIKKWLSLIPGINKYFLEQEAKIKADKIIKMKRDNIK